MNTLLESRTAPLSSKTLRAAFITTTVSGVAYYRMASLAWKMRTWPRVETVVWPYSKNVTIENPWQKDLIDSSEVRRIIDSLCARADVVVWQMLDFQHSLDFWMDMRNRHQKPFLMEIDDFVSDIPVENAGFEQLRPGGIRHRVMMEQMRLSDALVVSTPYLAKQYEGMNENIFVIPNSIDLDEWDGAYESQKKGSRTRIGWIGGGSHNADLEMVLPVIEEICKNDVWFYCIHGVPDSFKNKRNVYWTHKWSKINLYPKFLGSFKFDIGIAPLVDNNFNRGKSNLRWLEYSALKIPTVASPLPDFSRSIEQGKTGFLASDLDSWAKHLKELIASDSLRKEIGRNAYQSIKTNFNVRKTSTNYMHLLKGIVNGELPSNTF
jgi:glycosyltransferase involved in cell wall biosynthesis